MPLCAIAGRLVHAPASDRCRLDRRASVGRDETLAALERELPVSRVENVPSRLAPELERLGYRLSPKEPDYLYRAADLAALAGNRYKSQRVLCNRFEREQSFEMDSYQVRDRQDCRALLKEWSRQKQAEGLESFGVMLLADAVPAHEFIWAQASALRVTGRLSEVTVGCARIPLAIG